jgi:20S proteasome alpha/beta subunit
VLRTQAKPHAEPDKVPSPTPRIGVLDIRKPTTVGTSVIALKYKDGVVVAYNNSLTQYGMHLFDNVQRHFTD